VKYSAGDFCVPELNASSAMRFIQDFNMNINSQVIQTVKINRQEGVSCTVSLTHHYWYLNCIRCCVKVLYRTLYSGRSVMWYFKVLLFWTLSIIYYVIHT